MGGTQAFLEQPRKSPGCLTQVCGSDRWIHVMPPSLCNTRRMFRSFPGQYQCRILQSTSHNQLQLLSTLDTDIILRAAVMERDFQPRVTSAPLTLPFMPAFYVQTSELQLSNTIPTATLRVAGIDRVLMDLKVSG